MNTPIEKMIDDAVKCVKCGAAYGECDCWDKRSDNPPPFQELSQVEKEQ